MGSHMRRKIGVLGACETGGLTATFRSLMPRDQFVPLTFPQGDADAQRHWFSTALADMDLVLVNNAYTLPSGEGETIDAKLIKYPYIKFHAFHPDMTYVSRMVDGQHHMIQPDYNSCICIWSYVNDLLPQRAAELFNDDIFSRLGYYDQWDCSVSDLAEQFGLLGYNWSRFFHKVKRQGVFMLSHNHPKIATIDALAKSIAIDKLGESDSITQIDTYTADHLAILSWPVYPEIGASYGVRSRYDFDYKGEILNLERYIVEIYKNYDTLNLKRNEVYFGRPGFLPLIDSVLREYVV